MLPTYIEKSIVSELSWSINIMMRFSMIRYTFLFPFFVIVFYHVGNPLLILNYCLVLKMTRKMKVIFYYSRLTGLDPAYPGYYPPLLGSPISSSDAAFVDIIHTDGGGFGTPTHSGHADFWPNEGGAKQPGCFTATVPLTVEGTLLGTAYWVTRIPELDWTVKLATFDSAVLIIALCSWYFDHCGTRLQCRTSMEYRYSVYNEWNAWWN